jgi:hypothetical protein
MLLNLYRVSFYLFILTVKIFVHPSKNVAVTCKKNYGGSKIKPRNRVVGENLSGCRTGDHNKITVIHQKAFTHCHFLCFSLHFLSVILRERIASLSC